MAASSTKPTKGPEGLEIRCPRLGGTVPFRYCMAPGEPVPCWKILDCWWETFDVTSYLKAHLPEEALEALLRDRDPPDRLNTILELVERFNKTKPAGEG